jgi:hypothetical protein
MSETDVTVAWIEIYGFISSKIFIVQGIVEQENRIRRTEEQDKKQLQT